MEYTVQKSGYLAGISTRTLRCYDEIGILKPARINSSGYRIYGQKEAHAGLAQMYVDDERFTAFYDKHQPGLATFLRDAVLVYTGLKK